MEYLLFLIAHVLGDFTLQTRALVLAKNKKWVYLLVHALVYLLPVSFVLIIFVDSWMLLLYIGIVFISHFGIDWLKNILNRQYDNPYAHQLVFFLDQFLHLGILTIIYALVVVPNTYVFMLDRDDIFLIFAFLLCLSPASILIKHLLACVDYEINKRHRRAYLEELAKTKNEERKAELETLIKESSRSYSTQEIDANQAGSLIGKLERITILILGVMGLYTSIGLVLAAKSLARFKQLDDKDFGEKYLIGTLASVLFTMVLIYIMNYVVILL
jgi:hypothetical protein